MSSIEDFLKRHGYYIGYTNTEYTLKLIDDMIMRINTVKPGTYKKLCSLYEEFIDRVNKERPASAQAINLLREIGLVIAEGIEFRSNVGGIVAKINNILSNWRKKVVDECIEAAKIASRRLVDGDVVLTHSRSLCVLEAIKKAREEGKRLEFYVTESRPGMEGLKTAEEINRIGYPVKLIIDSAIRFFMKDIDKVLVGAEAVAVNGAVVSKVGMSLISLIANEARVRVFVIAPLSKFNVETLFGELVELPEGDWRRLMSPEVLAELPENYNARVPLYDVAPPSYIDGIATERGLFAPQAIPVVLKDIYGTWPPRVVELEDVLAKIKSLLR